VINGVPFWAGFKTIFCIKTVNADLIAVFIVLPIFAVYL
jgi:hypothetical protein